MKLNKTEVTIILASFYVFFSFAANIAATKITYFGSLVMDAGFIYALTFTWRDLIHKQLGKKAAIMTIIVAAVINLLAALYFQLVVILPSQPDWVKAGGQAAWVFIFSIQFRVVIASIITQVIAELADTQTYQWWTDGIGKNRPQWLRVVVSNAISIPIDSILFPLMAFTGIVGGAVIWQMFVTNIAVKALVTVGSMWLIYIVPEKKIYSD